MGPGGDPGTELRAAARGDLLRLAEKGMLKVVMAATYPLSEVAAAHGASATGHARGQDRPRPLTTPLPRNTGATTPAGNIAG